MNEPHRTPPAIDDGRRGINLPDGKTPDPCAATGSSKNRRQVEGSGVITSGVKSGRAVGPVIRVSVPAEVGRTVRRLYGLNCECHETVEAINGLTHLGWSLVIKPALVSAGGRGGNETVMKTALECFNELIERMSHDRTYGEGERQSGACLALEFLKDSHATLRHSVWASGL